MWECTVSPPVRIVVNVLTYTERYATGVNNVVDTGTKSWWPRQEEWLASARNVGYWSWRNELWYRTRRDELAAGRGKPYSIKEWQEQLKSDRFWPKIATQMEQSAIAALSAA